MIGTLAILPLLMSAVAGIVSLIAIMAKGERAALAFLMLALPLMVALILTMAAA